MRSRTSKRTATLVLVAALAALTVSATWAFAQGGERGWSMSRFGTGMMGSSSSGEESPSATWPARSAKPRRSPSGSTCVSAR